MKLLQITFVFALCISLGVNAQDQRGEPSPQPEVNIRLYPNPATDFVSIQFAKKNSSDYTISLHNVIGNIVEAEVLVVDDEEILIKLKDLPQGYYFVSIQHSGLYHKMMKFLKR